jgi:hypothetical protein
MGADRVQGDALNSEASPLTIPDFAARKKREAAGPPQYSQVRGNSRRDWVRSGTQEVGAHGRESWHRVQAIWKAIDDYAELETGNREYFWNRPHSIG